MKKQGFLIPLLVFLAVMPAFADDDSLNPPEKAPAEVLPFAEKGTKLLTFTSADLNGDGRQDYLIVLEKAKEKTGEEEDAVGKDRSLLIVMRQPDGSLKQVKRNDKIIMCSNCGGMMGDPFYKLEAGPKTFTIGLNGGGAGERWLYEFTFDYSRKDNTWQLTLASDMQFVVGEGEDAEPKLYKPPKDYGKIDVQDFDPEDYLGKGAK